MTIGEVIQNLRTTMLAHDGAGLTDGQLLEAFVNRRDEAALAALVRHHGPMVWGVCRRVLHHYHDAEDAFQTTFLVLVRKATSIVPREMVANWLYGVAHQTALKAKQSGARRRARERQVFDMPEREVVEQSPLDDLQFLLDRELSRLPASYRAVLVLCDLEGKTRKEAARQLGWPEGTVMGRLARARAQLARRLTRQGVAVSGGALAAYLAQGAASAGVPDAVLSSTIKVATLFAAWETALPASLSGQVAALTEGVLKGMLLSKVKTALMAVLLLAALGLGAGMMTGLTPSRSDAAREGDQAANEKPADNAVAGLSLAEFKELKPILDIKNQPWSTIPWKYSITEARKLAAATKKPIFMIANTGNALGCT
jgi:RNA polymerase sigma factor (sigma-70 family)